VEHVPANRNGAEPHTDASRNGSHANGNGNGNGVLADFNGQAANGNGMHANGNGAAHIAERIPWLSIAATPCEAEEVESSTPTQVTEAESQPDDAPADSKEAPAAAGEAFSTTETSAAPETSDVTEGAAAHALEPEQAGLIERGRMRRRILYLRALRELQLRDIGGFVLELHRYGTERPGLVQAKVDNAALVDAELRALERALGDEHAPGQIRAPGIGGACEQCGAVHGSADRFCAHCGQALVDDPLPGDAEPPLLASSANASVGEAEPVQGGEVATTLLDDTLPDEA
jgi:hypothetical protein